MWGSSSPPWLPAWIEVRRVDSGEPEGWRGAVVRRTLIEEEFFVEFNLIDWGVIVTNLFLDYLKSIIQPHSALCHSILDIGHYLDGVAHNVVVGHGVFLHVNHMPNWWPLW
jgi:hypothetical protein